MPESQRRILVPPVAVSWLLPQLAPARRQGANTNQNTNVAGRSKTGRDLSRAEAPARSSLPAGCIRQPGQVSKEGADSGMMVKAS